MLIHVWTLEGKKETLNVNSSYNIEELKAMIQDKLGIPYDEQHWIYGGKLLEDGRTLSSYNIRKGANIHVVRRARVRLSTDVKK